ncbi:MAG: dihydropteroate synthase [Candidatus Kapabacteria bacterium]|nr:dihydropteroate synthase [Candidatus Kapabacteria bacterium]
MADLLGSLPQMPFPLVMGIVNTTPDSFSDGGNFITVEAAVNHGIRLLDDGADILDIGGESTRPGAEAVTTDEELRRVIPVIEGIRAIQPNCVISIDTSKADVAQRAVEAGAQMINDVSAGVFDSRMFSVAVSANVPYVLMHMQGKPRTMQQNPHYGNVIEEVYSFLELRIQAARDAGVNNCIADVGIGFGKSIDHNLTLLRHHTRFLELGVPMLLGFSRKTMLGKITGIESPASRDEATALLHALLAQSGASIIRVHDVSRITLLKKLYNALYAPDCEA